MLNRNVSLAAIVLSAASVTAFGQPGAGFLFQLAGQNTTGSRLVGYGYNANPFNPVIDTPGPTGAFQVVAKPDGSKFYVIGSTAQVANQGFSTFTTLNGLIGAPTAIAVTPDGKYALVGAGDFYVLDSNTNQIVLDITAGGTIAGIATSRDSKFAYVLSNSPFGSTVTPVNLVNLTKGSAIILTGGATSITMSPLGLLYVTAVNRVFELDPATLNITVGGTIQLNATPGPLRFTPDGLFAYFVNLSSNITGAAILQLTLANHGVATWPAVTGNGTPQFDDVYIAGNGRIFTFSSQTTTLYDVTPTPFGVSQSTLGAVLPVQNVVGVAVSNEVPSARFLYALVVNGGQDSIYRIDLTTNQVNIQTQSALNGGVMQFVGVPPNTGAAGFVQFNNSQTLAAGTTSLPLIVRVLDGTGRPIFGIPVLFTTDASTGLTIKTPSPVSNADGYVQTTIVAPAAPGVYSIAVTAGTANTTFTITVPGSGGGGGGGGGGTVQQVFVVAGDGQMIPQFESTAFTGELLTVLVTDTSGKPLPNVAVGFAVTTGLGNVGTASTQTDQNGLAASSFISSTPGFGQAFETDTVTATTPYGSVTFTETSLVTFTPGGNGQAAPSPQVVLQSPSIDSNFTVTLGQGSVLQNGIQALILAASLPQVGTPIPGISIRIVDPNQVPNVPSPYASCQGTTLSDQNGVAHCNVLAKCQRGTFPIGIVIGDFVQRIGTVVVTAGSAQQLKIASGNNQTALSGQAAQFPLTAVVTDGCGSPVSGAQVAFSIIQGSATLSNTINVSGSSGQVSTKITMGPTPGPVQVRVTLGSIGQVLFQLTNQIVVGSMAPVAGNNQTGLVNQAFAQPVTVLVSDTNGKPVPGLSVSFSVSSGSAGVNPTSATTDSQGRASTTVTAGAAPGTILITATYGAFSASFTLTATPVGPSITPASFVNAASFAPGLVPCGLATVTGNGIALTSGGSPGGGIFGPLPYVINGLSIIISGSQAPMFSVSNLNGVQQATFQTPCEVPLGTATVVVQLSGATTTITGVPVLQAQPGIFTFQGANGKTYGEVIRAADGSYVTPTPSSYARRMETYYIVATGLGLVTPATATNNLGVPGQNVNLQLVVGVNNLGVPIVSQQYFAGSIGLYLVGFQIPDSAQTGPDQALALAVVINGQTIFGNQCFLAGVQ